MANFVTPRIYPDDFTQEQGYDTNLLTFQINSNLTITTAFLSVDPDYTTINFVFAGTLPTDQENELTSIVAAHDPSTQSVPVGADSIQAISAPISATFVNGEWKELGEITWDNVRGEIISSRFISYISGLGTYGIRLFNVTENLPVTTMTGMSNDITATQSFNDSTIQNQPINTSVLSIQGIVTDTSARVNLRNFEITFD